MVWHKLASPRAFYQFSGRCLAWIWLLFACSFAFGVIDGLLFAPSDYQQGHGYRIMFVHVPSAMMSMAVYFMVASYSFIFLIWRVKLADVLAQVSVPIGAMFTALALITGSLWGKPMWGTWWIWDARLTSELILLFLFFGLYALRSAIPSREKAAKACSIFALVGIVDLPIIHYSVYWWNTLHQQSTLLRVGAPTIAPSMLWPLLAMIVAFTSYFVAILLMRSRNELLERESETEWVKTILLEQR